MSPCGEGEGNGLHSRLDCLFRAVHLLTFDHSCVLTVVRGLLKTFASAFLSSCASLMQALGFFLLHLPLLVCSFSSQCSLRVLPTLLLASSSSVHQSAQCRLSEPFFVICYLQFFRYMNLVLILHCLLPTHSQQQPPTFSRLLCLHSEKAHPPSMVHCRFGKNQVFTRLVRLTWAAGELIPVAQPRFMDTT